MSTQTSTSSASPPQAQKEHSTILTRHRRQVITETLHQLAESEAEARPSPSPVSKKSLSKKQKRQEQGRRLQAILKEKRENGELSANKKKPRSKSQKSGIYFPVNTFLKRLKKESPHRRIYQASAVMLASVLEYLTAEVLEIAGNVAIESKKQRITPRHIFLAIENDQELELLLKDAILVQGGTMPRIHPVLLQQKTSKIPYKPRDAAVPKNQKSNGKRKELDELDVNENDDSVDSSSDNEDSNRTSTPIKKLKH